MGGFAGRDSGLAGPGSLWRSRDPVNSRRIIGAAIFGVVGVAILLALGVWQVQRLAGKQAAIAELEARLAAEPVPLPGDLDADRDRLLRVAATGRLGETELHVISSMRPWGPGYRVISPLTLEDGRRVLLDRGFIPHDLKDAAARPGSGGLDARPIELTGLLLWPAEEDSFTPEPDLGRNIWFARDVDAMAEALGTEPVLIVTETAGPDEWPRPDPPGVDIPNRHLEYALTWFGLALAWAVMTVLLIRAETRGRAPTRL